MIQYCDAEEFIDYSMEYPVIDVRSPREFGDGHIFNAYNIPLFDNEERKKVGIRYKNSGKEHAILLGLDIVGPKLTAFVKKLKETVKQKNILLHCWRGGMRSKNMAWLFDMAGFNVFVLNGGYKAYRNYIREYFEKKANIIILGGMTGCGKTDILHFIKKSGEQVLDLEKIANHKGSAFGNLGIQPTNEQFENNIFYFWKKFNLNNPIWIEDESISIGSVSIPAPLFNQMKNTDVIKIDLDKKIRVNRLVREYANVDVQILKNNILKISKRLGGLNTKKTIEALDKYDFHSVADISLVYYDKAYNYGLSKRDKNKIHPIILDEDIPEKNARKIIDFFYSFNKD